MANFLLRYLIKLITKLNAISIGTKYFPTNSVETEYVELFNYTQTILLEIKKANISTDSIFNNLIRDIGEENIPDKYNFYEIKAAENEVDEYALVSNIIMGSDRYFYIELPYPTQLINLFGDIIQGDDGEIIKMSSTEIISKLPSKNDAIRIAIQLISLALDQGITVSSAVGMTGAAAIERSIQFNKEVGDFSGVAFTKLGGEYALVFDEPFTLKNPRRRELQNYLFIDIINSTKYIEKYGRDKLVEVMTSIKNFIENECNGELEGYREGGDDFIARFPSKDLAIRAGLDSAWYIVNNDAKIRAGIGKSRREAGERAQLVDEINGGSSLSLVIFEIAEGLYAYNIPSEFARTILDLINHRKKKLFGIFLFVFLFTYLISILGFGTYSFIAIIIVLIYAVVS